MTSPSVKSVDHASTLSQWMREGARTLEHSLSDSNIKVLGDMCAKIIASLRAGGKVLLCGNGGSASQAQHIAAELVGRFKRERRGLAAVSLTTDTSILTAMGNDYGYDSIFARQVESLGRTGDVLIALSTSGNSSNVLKAVEKALSQHMAVAAFTGQKGGKLSAMTPLVFRSASDDTSHIQEAHITALHAICDVIEATLAQ